MKIKQWLTLTGAVVLFSGSLLLGGPAVKALAAGGPSTGVGGQAVQAANWNGAGIGLGRANGGMVTSVSQLLGIDVSELITARQSGKSMVQIAAEKGVSEQQLVEYVIGQRGTQIDQLVKDGRITQAQADLHKQFMAEQVKENLNRTTVGPNRSGTAGGQAFKAGAGARAGMAAGGAGRGAGYGARAGNCPYYPGSAK